MLSNITPTLYYSVGDLDGIPSEHCEGRVEEPGSVPGLDQDPGVPCPPVHGHIQRERLRNYGWCVPVQTCQGNPF